MGNGDSPADQFMRTILDGAAAYERALIRARTRAALKARRAQGKRAGAVPWGYVSVDEEGTLRDSPAEREVVERVVALRAEGRSLRGSCGPSTRTAPARGPARASSSPRWPASSSR